ncbi:MAG: cation-translocating P-type ATPase, partial [Oscillospiraceae bacterium]
DIMLIVEGVKIPADGVVVSSNDLSVDESSLTGEAEAVWKVPTEQAIESGDYWRKDYCYAGTLVIQGSGYIQVDKIGALTEYGKIGTDVATAPQEDTPLQKQTGSLVKMCAIIAALLFLSVGAITWANIPDHSFGERLIESVLSGITLAMAMIPEEFPVILTVFLSMGAWRLAKKNSLVRKLPSVETLGAISVLCVDKTGTITMNQMTVQETWQKGDNSYDLCKIMGMACETDAYDPMEKAMLSHCEKIGINREDLFSGELVSEYSFTNESKMMGHVWHRGEKIIIAAKGSPESILPLCIMSEEDRATAQNKALKMSESGLRIIAVADESIGSIEDIPGQLSDCTLHLKGLVGLADPPRESVKADIDRCNKAGIRVVMITGDNGVTACAIAKQVGIPNAQHIITGDEISKMSDEELRDRVKDVSIFSRVVPEHKMRIVKAFKENGEIVAMTGDGVNDAPALKYADIGIAMGKRGSEVSREAADLILMDDNFTTIVETVRDGRRIYDNIRKAVGYVFTIHIPIAFASLLAPLMGIEPTSLLLLPLHVVLLELIIDPTCSIVLERQPAERNIMERPPRDPKEKLLTGGVLLKSVAQGLVLFGASFGTYFLVMSKTADPSLARTMGLAIIMIANLLLVQVNSSEVDFAIQSFFRLIKDKVMWSVILGTIGGLCLIMYTPLCGFLKLAPLSAGQLFITFAIAAVSVLWYEVVKLIKRLLKKP